MTANLEFSLRSAIVRVGGGGGCRQAYSRMVVGWQVSKTLYAERPADEVLVASVGSRGDSYDDSLAEAFNSLFKAELIRDRLKGPLGDESATSRSLSPSTATYSTTGECTSRSATSYRPNTKPNTAPANPNQRPPTEGRHRER